MNADRDREGPRHETTPPSARLTWICSALHVPAWALLFLSLIFLVPKFEMIFADFGIDLPAITKVAVRASHLVVSSGILVIPAVIGTALTLDFLLLGRGSARDPLGWSLIGLLLPLGLFAATVAALLIPLISLHTRLSG
jgi:hypothetical protein